VRKGWRDLAAAIGCDKLSETGSRADLHGYTSPYDFNPESRSRWTSTRGLEEP